MIETFKGWLLLPQFWACIVILLMWIISKFNPHPKVIFNDHVHYLHASLGKGKTALAAHYVDRLTAEPLADRWLRVIFRKPPKTRPVVYSSFELKGARPLNLKEATWPRERNALIVIDEILLLESNDLLPQTWFSRGCTLARQLGQQVILISQASRLPRKLDKYKGTIGVWLIVNGISFGQFGRFVTVNKSGEPFTRRSKGFKSHGAQRFFVWIPGRVFRSYNSRKIYGYTVNDAGDWIDVDAAHNARGFDVAQSGHDAAESSDGVPSAIAASAKALALDGTRATPSEKPSAKSPHWHRKKRRKGAGV